MFTMQEPPASHVLDKEGPSTSEDLPMVDRYQPRTQDVLLIRARSGASKTVEVS